MSWTSCETVTGSIVALLDGELPSAERRAVELHVAECASCRDEMALLRTTRELISERLAAVASRTSPPSFAALWQRLEDESSPARRAERTGQPSSRVVPIGAARGRRRLALWAGAGGFALAAGLALVVLGHQQRELPEAKQTTRSRRPVVASAPAPAVAKAEPKAATRVAKRKPSEPAAHEAEVAKREEPAPEGETAVAVNELDPPRELLERPELFINYPLVRKLDELRHLESVLADPPDQGGSG